MTIKEIFYIIHERTCSCIVYEDRQLEYPGKAQLEMDEMLVAEIKRLRKIIIGAADQMESLEEQIHDSQDPWEDE